jgi:hypothetical protein
MEFHQMNLNVRYDDGKEAWDKIPFIYSKLDGWLGFGEGGDKGQKGIPYWYGYNENGKHILASVEPSGLHFSGLLEKEEWEVWKKAIKEAATKVLGFKVGEIELGEVGY